jgi:hypothetical protein
MTGVGVSCNLLPCEKHLACDMRLDICGARYVAVGFGMSIRSLHGGDDLVKRVADPLKSCKERLNILECRGAEL